MNYLYGKVERFTFWVVSASMNTCDTCRYWSGKKEAAMQWCSNPKLMIGGKIPPESDAIYGAAEGLSCIVTGPKFGCVHWEAKDAG